MRSVITVTTGEAGSGKSFARCAQFLTRRFLFDADGTHWSNFPLGTVPEEHSFPPTFEGETFRDRIAAEVAPKLGVSPAEVLERIQLIPPEVMASWETGESGPWDFFEGKDLSGCHIAIDEIHNYCDVQGPPELKKRWRQWLGEIRHQGATVEFLSQSLQKVPLEIRREAGLHIAVKNTETERDPFFRIELADWYELRAGFLTREYRSNVMEAERRSAMGDARRFQSRRLFPLDPELFRFYDSFSRPQKGGQAGKASRRQWERRSRLGLLAWFCGKNAFRLLPKVALVLFFVWLVFGGSFGLGGGSWLVKRAFAASTMASQAVGGDSGEPKKAEAAKSPKVTPERVQADAVVPGEVKDLVAQLKEERDEAKASLEAAKAAMERASAVVLLEPDAVTFQSGDRYRVGEQIEWGQYKGRRIEKIEWRRRTVTLSGGVVLRMGGGRRGGLSELLGTGN